MVADKDKNKDLETKLGERLYDMEMKPNADMWSSIDATLSASTSITKEQVDPNDNNNSRRSKLARKIVLGTSVAALLLMSLLVINNNNTDVNLSDTGLYNTVNESVSVVNQINDRISSVPIINSDVNKADEEVNNIVNKIKPEKEGSIVAILNSSDEDVNTLSVINDIVNNNVDTSVIKLDECISKSSEQEAVNGVYSRKRRDVNNLNIPKHSVNNSLFRGKEIGNIHKDKGLTLSVNSNGSIGSGVNGSVPIGINRFKSLGRDVMAMNFISAISEDKSEDWDHRFPITAGLSIRKMITRRIGIETGLQYTYLYSDARCSFANNDIITKQSLHYLGIPVSLLYKIVDRNRFDIYVKAGGLIDKAISSERRTEYDNGKVLTDNLSNGVQFSASLRFGGTYHINNWLGLFVEPSYNYYFSSNEPISYRTEHQFSFSATFGLRFNL